MIFNGHPQLNFWQEEQVYHLDVRPMLEEGGEPYAHIMELVGQLEDGDALIVHVLFEPKPLIKQIERMEKRAVPRRVSEEYWLLEVSNQG